MKLFIFVLCLAVCSLTKADDSHDKAWEDFKVKHNKVQMSPKKEATRKETFVKRFVSMNEHNERFANGEERWAKDLYAHSDLPRDSFVAKFCGAKTELHNSSLPKLKIQVRGTLPTRWDIRYNGPGKLQPVKNQGQCGSCWTFSTTGTVENILSKQGINIAVSEQQQVDCTYPRDGCDGGWFSDAYDYVISNGLYCGGSYPYAGTYGTCKTASGNKYKITGYNEMNGDADTIKAALANGACAACVDATYWGQYKTGIYSDTRASTETCNHAVTLIGYESNSWIIRNSWGTSWGEAGHIRLANDGTGGIVLGYTYCPY